MIAIYLISFFAIRR